MVTDANGDLMDDYQDASTRVIAQRMRALRRQRGWSAEHLAGEMTCAGVDWERGVVTKLENGRRESITVEELCALSYALKVSPLDLLTPDEHDVPGSDAYGWALGQLSTAPVSTDDGPTLQRRVTATVTSHLAPIRDELARLGARIDEQAGGA